MNFDQFQRPQECDFFATSYQQNQYGNAILLNEDFDATKLILIGVTTAEYEQEANLIRKEIYELYQHSQKPFVYDLGNFYLQNNEPFSFRQLAEILAELIAQNKVPILFGGSQKGMVSIQQAFALVNQYNNMGMIHSKFEVSEVDTDIITDENYLFHILNNPESYLFNFSQIGYQTYFVSPETIQLYQQLCFEEVRLGNVRAHIEDVEPIIRDLDALGASLKALKYSESGQSSNSPNGLYAEELAQLFRYAGMSDKMKCIGCFDLDEQFCQDPNIGAQLFAQAIYCFVEGYHLRKNEWPDEQHQHFLKYIVKNDEADIDFVFLKSELSGRWWVQMPKQFAKLEQKFYIPCAYSDYQTAINGDIPERWMRGFNKLG